MSLWTNITGAVRSLAPLIGGAIAGPVGAGVGALFVPQPKTASLMPMPLPGGMPGTGMMQTAGVPKLPSVPSMGQMFSQGLRWLIGPRGIARSAAGKIVGVMRGTTLFRNKKAIALAKQIGIDAAAVALGITVADVAEMFVAEAGKRRRVRGISGRDIKCTRRTLGKLRSVQRLIGAAAPRRSAPRRPSTVVRCD